MLYFIPQQEHQGTIPLLGCCVCPSSRWLLRSSSTSNPLVPPFKTPLLSGGSRWKFPLKQAPPHWMKASSGGAAANALRGWAFHLPAALSTWLFVLAPAAKVVCLWCKTSARETLKFPAWLSVAYCSCQQRPDKPDGLKVSTLMPSLTRRLVFNRLGKWLSVEIVMHH